MSHPLLPSAPPIVLPLSLSLTPSPHISGLIEDWRLELECLVCRSLRQRFVNLGYADEQEANC